MNPGSVSSADRMPPPIVGAASITRTESPSRASVIAAANPLGPDPTTTASYLASGILRDSSHVPPLAEGAMNSTVQV